MPVTSSDINSYIAKAQRAIAERMIKAARIERTGGDAIDIYLQCRYLSAAVRVLSNSNNGLTNEEKEKIIHNMIDCGDIADYLGTAFTLPAITVYNPSCCPTNITDLADGPGGSLVGNELKQLRINSAGTAWEWFTPSFNVSNVFVSISITYASYSFYFEILYADLVTLKAGNGLSPGCLYFITDKGIYVTSTSSSGLSTSGIYKATNVDHDNVSGDFIGVWQGTYTMEYTPISGWLSQGEIITGGTSGAEGEVMINFDNNPGTFICVNVISKNGIAFTPGEVITGTSTSDGTVVTVDTTAISGSIAINKIMSWSGVHYKNLTGSATIIHPKYDATNWVALALTDTSYQIEYDPIVYDFANDLIIAREDKRGNKVVDKEGVSTIRFQWGRDAVKGNKIYSFGFEGWNAVNAQDFLFIQDSSCYIGDTASIRFSLITGRSTTRFVGASVAFRVNMTTANLQMINGNANEIRASNFADISVKDVNASIPNTEVESSHILVEGISQIFYCKIIGGVPPLSKTFNNENHTSKEYIKDAYSTFSTAISQTSAAAALTLNANLFYGIYDLTITGAAATLTSIVNLPPVMPVRINIASASTYGATIQHAYGGPIQLRGYGDKLLLPASKDWITFQTIQGINQEVDSSLGAALPVLNTLYVSKSAVAAYSIKGRFDRPFLTIAAAQTAASSGDTILIMPGTYTDTGLGKDGVNYHFMSGAILSFASDAFIGNDISYKITGDGTFTGGSARVISTSGNCVISMDSNSISNVSEAMFVTSNTEKIYINAKKSISSTTAAGYSMITAYGTSEINVTCDYITTPSSVASCAASTATIFINSKKILGTGTLESLFLLGGNLTVYGDIYYTSTANIVAGNTFASKAKFYGEIISATCGKVLNITTAMSGTVDFYGRISSTAGGITMTNGTAEVTFHNYMTANTSSTPVINMTIGTVRIKDKLKNLDVNATSYGITKTAGTLILDNATIVTSGGTECVNSAAAQDILILGTLSSNVALSANITDITSGIQQIDSNVQ
ncbi:MAG: hypothetical protein IT212_07570 [Bacteroidia bacterium]|nr:hypothetical protein [Bacteroidia bacterium]